MAELSGFDVSQWQSGAYSGGGGFAFGIAKMSEGVGFKDPAADRHMAAILAQPIVPGGYHFSRPDLNPGTSGAYAEADWFWNVATSYGGALGMLLAHDAESAGGSLQWCEDFAGRLSWRLGGYSPWFYSYLSWMQTRGILGSGLLARDPLWFAWPAAGPPPFAVAMQQYGLTSVPGIGGQVDANRFFGDVGQLRSFALRGGHPSDEPSQGGDAMSLLSTIAGRLDFVSVGSDGNVYHRWKTTKVTDLATSNESWGSPPGAPLVRCEAAYDDGGATITVVAVAPDETVWACQRKVADGSIVNDWFALDPANLRVYLPPSGGAGPAGPPGPAYDDAALRALVTGADTKAQKALDELANIHRGTQ